MRSSKRRLLRDYPATLWLLGLLLLLKSCFWLFASPLIIEPVLGIKHLVTTIPFFLLCLMIWSGKKGFLETGLILTLVLIVVDLLFFMVLFRTCFYVSFDIYPLDSTGGFSPMIFILNGLIYFCSAMIGYGIDFLILALDLFSLFRQKSAGPFSEYPESIR